MSNQPILQNIRILDFSWVLAGPYATRLLADFGAEVIKVQPPMPEVENKFSQGYYNTWNRNKLGITLNLEKPAGIEIARKLVKISDVLVENFSPRVMSNWGLDYLELKKLRPDIIYLSLSVMGHSGPWRDYSGFGPTVQAFSGITYLTAYPGRPPSGIGYSYSDHIAGLYASLALLGALEHRRQTGEGQHIDLSQTEAAASLLSDAVVDCTLKGEVPEPPGNRSSQAAPHAIYPCNGQDRWCAIAVTTDEEWVCFKRALGNPAWANEKRFATLASRRQNSEPLDNLVQKWTMTHAAEDVMSIMQREGIPAGIVANAADLAQDPQLRARGFFVQLQHPVMGKTVADATPIKFSASSAVYRRAAPTRGQDNDYVFRQLLDLSEVEISRLRQNNII
jgi:benzylsuccinate CoA-transferase BbsF subunit